MPHGITFVQDVKNKDNFLEGVEIMTKVLPIDKKGTRNLEKAKGASLDYILPFGEADRSALAGRFTSGQLSPLTDEIKSRDVELLRNFEKEFNF